MDIFCCGHCLDVPCTFGPYTPYLETVFAINILFSAWGGLYEKLGRFHRKSEESDNRLMARVEMSQELIQGINRHRKYAGHVRTGITNVGRISGVAIGAAIVFSLLTVPPNTTVQSWVWLLWLAGGWVPGLMVVLVFVDWRYGRWITKRVEKLARETADTTKPPTTAGTSYASEEMRAALLRRLRERRRESRDSDGSG